MKAFLIDHLGLGRPRRFERTLAILAALLLGLATAAVALRMLAKDELHAGTPRFWFFVWMAALLALAIVLARRPRIAAVLLSLAALEAGLGFGSALLYKFRLAPSDTLFPMDYVRPHYDWHPLLQARPVPSASARSTRDLAHINSERRRGPPRGPAELEDRTVIALVGGSTTLDVSVRDGETWGEQLERLLGEPFAVINHGAAGYTTAEHVLQTAFYQDSYGVPPHCAVYYIGWNDLRNAHVAGLDPGYADFHLPSQVDALEARRLDSPWVSVSPTLKLLDRLAIVAFDSVRPPAVAFDAASGPDPALEKIYARNIATISAINRGRGIRTVWIGQLMNVEWLATSPGDGWLRMPGREVAGLIDWLNGVLKREAVRLGDTYIDIPAGTLRRADFADDPGHFTAGGAAKFAAAIAPGIKVACDR